MALDLSLPRNGVACPYRSPASLASHALAGLNVARAGGLAYTAGVAFFAAERLRYSHFIWHLFVLTGTCCHFFAVLWYAA